MQIIHIITCFILNPLNIRPFGFSAGFSNGRQVFRKNGGERGVKCEWKVTGFFSYE